MTRGIARFCLFPFRLQSVIRSLAAMEKIMLPLGIAFGLSAALTFGLSDFLSALVSRQIGTLYTLLGVQVVGIVLLLCYFLKAGDISHGVMESLPMLLLTGIGIGMIDVLAYLSFYKGLSIGPIVIVSPISSSYGLVTVILSVLVLGEVMTLRQALGIGLTLAGVVLVSLDDTVLPSRSLFRSLTLFLVAPISSSYGSIAVSLAIIVFGPLPRLWQIGGMGLTLVGVILTGLDMPALFQGIHRYVRFRKARWRQRAAKRWQRLTKSGSFWGCIAMVGFGLHLFLLSRWTQVVGSLIAVLSIRIVSALALIIFVLARRTPPPRHISRKSLGGIALIGLFDTIGLLTYSVGTTKALTSIVATIASSYSLIPVFLGIIVLRERLVRIQGVGIVVILVGLGILAIGTS